MPELDHESTVGVDLAASGESSGAALSSDSAGASEAPQDEGAGHDDAPAPAAVTGTFCHPVNAHFPAPRLQAARVVVANEDGTVDVVMENPDDPTNPTEYGHVPVAQAGAGPAGGVWFTPEGA